MRLLVLILCLGASLRAQPPLPDAAALERELKRFVDVFAIAMEQGADAPSSEQLIYAGAIPGMLRQLDPHSAFFNPDQFEQLREMQTSVSRGFGSIVSVLPGRVIVLQVQDGSPAARAGLAAGDEIVAINGIALGRLDPEQLVQVLGMTRQRKAEIFVRRPGTARLMPLTLTPAELQSPTVDRAFLAAPGVGYVRAASFDAQTGKEIREAIEKLGGKELKGLILDLRGNPGGVLTAALDTAALFLPPGAKLLSARGRGREVQSVDVPAGFEPYTFPLAVLIDERTASASEIVAGAIQDQDRGAVVGEPSFGKGLVQSIFPLSGETGLALTTAYYFTPSGRSIQRPLAAGKLQAATRPGPQPEYKTAKGRTVRGGGGIEPDAIVRPPAPSQFRFVLEASAAFPQFATEWLAAHRGEARRGMEITPAMLDDFQLWLSRRNIRPGIREWTAERMHITSRLKQEILNQSVGVDAGDEVEVERDPVVRRALDLLAASL
jgi:carboxyl-terminal processing protease